MAKEKDYKPLAADILRNVGGAENVVSVTHCMTRLRFVLRTESAASDAGLKALDEVMSVVHNGGQVQVVIGPQVAHVYDAVCALGGFAAQAPIDENLDAPKEKLTPKTVLNSVMGALGGCMTPLIPLLLCVGICKSLVAVLGPQLLGVISEGSDLYTLFTFVADAGFYFLPVIVGYTAAQKFRMTPAMGMFFGAILVHPTLIQMAAEGTPFTVYGIPASVQNYSSTVIPIILTVWVASYIERFFKKHTPDVLQVFGVPLGTLFITLPLELCVLGPLGSFLGNYICKGIIALYDLVGPLAVAIVGATFSLLVLGGMHIVLMVFLFTSFPMMGYDAFVIPGIMACSWAGAGVTLACILKFKDKKKKALTTGYLLTWLLGGVGEPMLYGLNLPYKTPLYAGVISGFLSGLVTGLLGLKAYVCNASNGLYIFPAFFGGPNSNYIVLVISVIASVALGFACMWFMPLNENAE